MLTAASHLELHVIDEIAQLHAVLPPDYVVSVLVHLHLGNVSLKEPHRTFQLIIQREGEESPWVPLLILQSESIDRQELCGTEIVLHPDGLLHEPGTLAEMQCIV